jgi:hypothetical protein
MTIVEHLDPDYIKYLKYKKKYLDLKHGGANGSKPNRGSFGANIKLFTESLTKMVTISPN